MDELPRERPRPTTIEPAQPQPDPAPPSPFESPEGRILVTGLALAAAYFSWLGASFFTASDMAHVYLGMTVAHILFGRAASMAFGYSLEFGHVVVVPVNLFIESFMVLGFYPLFVLGWKKLRVFSVLGRAIDRINASAEANRDTIRRFGIPGLFIFVFIPFWMTGPLVGSVIGYLLGLRAWVNMTVVLAGTYVATLVWALILKGLHDRVFEISPFAPVIVVVALIAVAVASHVLDLSKRTRKSNLE